MIKPRYKLYVVIISLFIVVSCQQGISTATENMHDQTLLTEVNWKLIRLNDQSIDKGEGEKPLTMTLSLIDNRASGYAGCNNYFGKFTLAKEQLTIGPLGMTRRFCQNSADLEHTFTKVLSQVTHFNVTEKNLTLLDKKQTIIAEFTHKQVK